MKKLVWLCLTLLFQTAWAWAQHPSWQDSTTVFVKERGYLKDPIRSKWKSHIKKVGNYWVLSLYDKRNVIQEQIQFIDDDLTERKGPYSAYQNGVISVKGQYEKGYKHGLWHYYNSEGKVIKEESYYFDRLHGILTHFWPNGEKKLVQNYVKGKLHGAATAFYANGSLAFEQEYEQGVLQPGAKFYDEKGNLIEQSKFKFSID